MPSPTLNGLSLLNCKITEQSTGVWHATELEVDGETAPTGTITITVSEDRGTAGIVDVTWTGTAVRLEAAHGKITGKVVGGKGGLSAELEAKNYVSTTAAAVLTDILTETGESLSATSATDLANHTLANWHREVGTAKIALTALATELGYSWRVLRDGKIWIGTHTWAATTAKAQEMDADWAGGTFELTDALALEPGTTYQGQRINEVTHFITKSAIRTEARVTSSSGVMERILDRVRREVDRSKTWPGTVARQWPTPGFEIDILPDGKDDRMRGSGVGKVPILFGVPGCTVEVPVGVRGYWTLLGGDPARPRWLGFEQGCSVTKLKIETTAEVTLESVLIKLGASATEAAVLGNALMTWLNAHTHPSGMGPTGTPTTPMTTAQLSSKVKVG
jgi:hypothetical protein